MVGKFLLHVANLRSTRRTQKISAGRTTPFLVHQLLPFFWQTCDIGWLLRNTGSVPPKISTTEKSEIRTYHSLLGKRLLFRSFRGVRFTCVAPGPRAVAVVLFADWVFFENLGPTITRQWCFVFWYAVNLRQWGGSDAHLWQMLSILVAQMNEQTCYRSVAEKIIARI